jgi:hypothetical protein
VEEPQTSHGLGLKYPVPVKSKNEEGNAIIVKKVKTVFNWINDIPAEFSTEDVKEAFSAHNKGTVHEKLHNTLDFYNEMKRTE